MKKQVALGIAGASAALIAGWKLVQEMTDREDIVVDPVEMAPGMPADSGEPQPADYGAAPESDEASTLSGSPSKAELYQVAQDLGIKGRSKMSKTELLKAIEKAG